MGEFIACLIIVVFFMIIGQLLKKQRETKDRPNEIGGTALDRFFVECVLAKVDDFSVSKNAERAKLLADKYKLAYPNGIEALYKLGREKHEPITQLFLQDKLEKKRNQEKKEFAKLNKYADLTGRDKRIAMLTDQLDLFRHNAKVLDDYSLTLMQSTQQREHDWASMGGLASGIAGPAAGLAIANDFQMQNMNIRAENARRYQAALPAYMSLSNSASVNRQNANQIEKEIEALKLKLVSDENSDELMNKIAFDNTDVLVSKTGAAMVCTSAAVKSKLTIYEDVPAVIDGTIVAKIYDEDRLCGTAQLVLPIYGLGEEPAVLNGICLDCCEQGKTYTAKFVAKHLWEMER